MRASVQAEIHLGENKKWGGGGLCRLLIFLCRYRNAYIYILCVGGHVVISMIDPVRYTHFLLCRLYS